jgi:hypothetical protein
MFPLLLPANTTYAPPTGMLISSVTGREAYAGMTINAIAVKKSTAINVLLLVFFMTCFILNRFKVFTGCFQFD